MEFIRKYLRSNKKTKTRLCIIAVVPILLILNRFFKNYPEFVEKYYSTSSDKIIRETLSIITSIYPYSFAELLVGVLIAVLIVLFIVLPVKIKKGGFFNHLLTIAAYISVLYILFMIFWGFNYRRLSFDRIAGLKIEKSSAKDLYELCEALITKANALRGHVEENAKGVMTIPGGYKSVFSRAGKGYEKAARIYPELGGVYGLPKRILLSPEMSYTGITGIYMPYTGEANVNINVTDFTLPATTAHEMAHQRGFAREDEANYIAYVVCSMHPDVDFQYSGVMLGLVYSMNALYSSDFKGFQRLAEQYSPGVARDLQYDAEFWSKYEGKVEKVSDNVNNTYLKSNGQTDGVQSYGRMVDLLLAQFKKNREI